MTKIKQDESTNTLQIEIDTSTLSPKQVRLIKSINMMLSHVTMTEVEGEYFDGSAELLRMCASLIKQSNFVNTTQDQEIAYAEQALEFSLDVLVEQIDKAAVVTYDN